MGVPTRVSQSLITVGDRFHFNGLRPSWEGREKSLHETELVVHSVDINGDLILAVTSDEYRDWQGTPRTSIRVPYNLALLMIEERIWEATEEVK